jgi:hypothetical protein
LLDFPPFSLPYVFDLSEGGTRLLWRRRIMECWERRRIFAEENLEKCSCSAAAAAYFFPLRHQSRGRRMRFRNKLSGAAILADSSTLVIKVNIQPHTL